MVLDASRIVDSRARQPSGLWLSRVSAYESARFVRRWGPSRVVAEESGTIVPLPLLQMAPEIREDRLRHVWHNVQARPLLLPAIRRAGGNAESSSSSMAPRREPQPVRDEEHWRPEIKEQR